MPLVQRGPVIGLFGQLGLLGLLAGTVGLGVAGGGVGAAVGLGLNATLARGLSRSGARGLGPADRVTLLRGVLAGGVAALTADATLRAGAFADRPLSEQGLRSPALRVLVALTVVALMLDGVDGWVARRTRTASALGARFDLEVDALLILVLSVLVARTGGPWVLLVGAARYLFLMAGWAWPWMRVTLPPRYWRKVVAAAQGVVLTTAAARVGPGWVTQLALAGALGLLAESFGRDVWWLWGRRDLAAGRRSMVFGRGDIVVTANIEVPATTPVSDA